MGEIVREAQGSMRDWRFWLRSSAETFAATFLLALTPHADAAWLAIAKWIDALVPAEYASIASVAILVVAFRAALKAVFYGALPALAAWARARLVRR